MNLVNSTSFIEILTATNLASIGLRSLKSLISTYSRRFNQKIQREFAKIREEKEAIRAQGLDPDGLSFINDAELGELEGQANSMFIDYTKLIDQVLYLMGLCASIVLLYCLFAIGLGWDGDHKFHLLIRYSGILFFCIFIYILFSIVPIQKTSRDSAAAITIFVIIIYNIICAKMDTGIETYFNTENLNLYYVAFIGAIPIISKEIIVLFLTNNYNKILARVIQKAETIHVNSQQLINATLNRNQIP